MRKAILLMLLVGHLTGGLCPIQAQVLAQVQRKSSEPVRQSKTIKLKEALNILKQQYGIDLLFFGKDLDSYEVPSSGINPSKSLEKNLDQLLSPLKLQYQKLDKGESYMITESKNLKTSQSTPNTSTKTVIGNKAAPRIEASPIEITIKGKVSDLDNGEPLPGVSIVIKGTQTGTITDTDGNFSLEVSDPTDLLIFSFVGYLPKEVTVGQQTQLNIQLSPDNKALDEIVVIGYSSKNQTQLSSSVSVVSAEKLKGVTSPSLGNLLQGKASGLMISSGTGQPGADPAIRIRGTGTISAGAGPLYVVDGVIGGTANPSDIESVTVLKDAAATGLYGSRAANGVIVITTKSGKSGKTNIQVNSSIGISEISRGKFRMMNTQEYYDYTRPLYVNDYNGKREGFIQQLEATNPNPSPEEINAYLTSKNLPTSLDDYLQVNFPESLLNYDTNWSDLIYRKGLTQNYDVSVSGGDEKTKFYIGGNYYHEKGTITTSAYERYNLRMNLDHRISQRLRLTGRINGRMDGTNYDYSGDRGGAYTTYFNLPTDRPYNDDGSIRIGTESDWFGRDRFNFLYPMQYNYSKSRSSDVQADLVLNYDINDWLSFSTTNRVSLKNQRAEIYDDPRTLTGGIRKGLLRNNSIYDQSLLNSNLLKASHNFGSHGISGLIGAEFQSNYGDFTNSSGGGVPIGLHVMDVSANPVAIAGSKYRSAFNSYFTQADYNYNNRYFLTASLRRDGSSKFGQNNQYGNFWAVGGSWILSNEAFIKNSKYISLLKLRASYGTTGNANITDFISRALYSYSTQYNGTAGAIPARLENPDLTWEKAYTTNLGLNIGFFNRIELSIDAYQRDTKNLLFDVPLSSATGFKTQIQNVGQIRNQGLDLELNTVNIKTENFTWTSNLNIGFNRNKVVALYQGQDIDLGTRRVIVGQPLGTWFMRKWLGVDPATGDPQWEIVHYNEDGSVKSREATNNYNLATRQIVGRGLPKFTGGFSNNLSYRGLHLDVFFTFTQGNQINHALRENLGADGAYPTTNSIALRPGDVRWEKPGDIAKYPRAVLGGNLNSNKMSSRYLENGSYIRLRNVRLGYDLPQAFIEKLKLGSLNIFVSGDNLLTWTKFSGMDPEVSLDNPSASLTNYFISKKVLFGINIGL
ncbi:TonB-linked SusC/RagA family outer membrane protein [Dyadobacter jejuensis]|uniref:TonB-linked SusC/RagA family outer membrane protein n=1 Tax=Dyadobacter jejuensis TaxID=1082580 RepID=A0A316ASZ1_9BACT|nr:TonB-dependent receptor [Dyadobacter jejuensis]PWJ60456.1 TonB-linked SusC/RagA family outer membrane protein [Dyadobacter jejuensis]